MTRICFIRHGETQWNKDGKTQGAADIELSYRGRDQANKIGEYIKDKDFDISEIYASDLKRSVETAEIINGYIDKTLIVEEAFREISFGEWEGLTMAEIKETYADDLITWRNEPHNMVFSSGDSLKKVKERSLKLIDEIVKKDNNEDKMVVIVSHAAAIKTMIISLLDLELKNYYKFSLSNTSLSIIEVRDYANVLTLFNEVNH